MNNKPKPHPVSPRIRQRAKELRQTQTEAEKALWKVLRGRQLGGYKFRRQHPLGSYIADFYCEAARLVVEVDGGVHLTANQRGNDIQRDTWMAENGYPVLRVSNTVVMGNIEQVKEIILRRLVSL